MKYIDGFVLPVPKKNLQACRRMPQKAGKICREGEGVVKGSVPQIRQFLD